MKITKLSLQNFRQFHGCHIIEFDADDTQNITVVHGENGAGKTSLLNAFKWCFYGRTDFDTGQQNILNEHAVVSANINEELPMSIEIEFEHDDYKYMAKRLQRYRKTGGLNAEPIGTAMLELSWTDPQGKYDKSKNPESQMSQILPEKMHSYFFFNGERIEKLAYASASQEIREAIRTLMGLEIVERGRDHLNGKVKKQLRRQIKHEASEELKQAIDDENNLDDQLEQTKKDVELEKNNIEEFKKEFRFVSNKLENIKATMELQNQRNKIEQRLNDIRSELSNIRVEMRSVICESGFLAFIQSVSQEVTSRLEESRQKGELPYPIKQQFVEDLLEREKCICDTKLVSGSPEYAAVESYRYSVEQEGIEDALYSTAGALKQVEWSRQELFRQLKGKITRRRVLESEQRDLLGQLDDINKQVNESEHEDAIALNQKRLDLEKKREDAIGRKARLEGDVEDLEKQLSEAQKKRKELAIQSERVEIARHRYDIAEECARVLSELHDALSSQTKEQLSKRVNDNFQKILQKDYWAEIDEDYCLQIFKEIPGHGPQIVHEKSTGESQVTSLSFIGSIVELAKEQHEKGAQFFRGGVFPIIMDSPFGSLDPLYRKLTARYIPELAEQIILLVSGTQWKGEVESECKHRVGKHVSLVYYAPTVGEGKESYYVRSCAEHEYTEIEEGYHG